MWKRASPREGKYNQESWSTVCLAGYPLAVVLITVPLPTYTTLVHMLDYIKRLGSWVDLLYNLLCLCRNYRKVQVFLYSRFLLIKFIPYKVEA